MRLSISITDFSWLPEPSRLAARLGDVAARAEAAGVDTLWLPDHLIQAAPGSDRDSPMLEAYTALGYLAARTERIRLGTLVTAATYRPAALLVKAVTTLDVLSGGRAWLGIGAGYLEDEAGALGLPLPPPRERAETLSETLQVALRMWSGDDDRPFEGRHLQLGRPVGSPLPLTRPHPPILIGGAGERRTLPLVARYADACNLFDIPDGGRTLTRKLQVLAELCETEGRDVAEIEKTVSTRVDAGDSPADLVERCTALARLGIDHAVVITAGPWSDDALAIVAESVPALEGVGVAAARGAGQA